MPKADEIRKDWYVVDATQKNVGRIATRIASVLRGKNKEYFSPHMDCGDFVVVINAEKVHFSGNKELNKIYKSFSGYPDGLKETPFRRMLEKKPEEILRHAIKGMLPKNALGRKIFRNLKVYAGTEHPHKAQQPVALSLED
ncbi:MAG: 50S ribosomal protein L13 [Candidatus Cloacimonadota bacterium]|nr:50S ribosomal protein L13 [Candidatus Cloacimonadota bacterium]